MTETPETLTPGKVAGLRMWADNEFADRPLTARWLNHLADECARLLEVERAARLYVQSIEARADGDSRRTAYAALRRLVDKEPKP